LGAGKIALIVIVTVVAGVVVATVAGVMPGASAYLGFAKQRDLGIKADKAAFDSAMVKAGIKAEYPATPVATGQLKVTGKKKLDATFTDDEVSALINAYVEPFEYNVRGVQVVFHDGGKGEASALVTYQGKDYPGYITGAVSLENGRVTGSATSANAAGIPAKGSWLSLGETKSIDFFNLQLAIPNLVIETAEMTEGQVRVTGTVPRSIAVTP
jgi:hypothetical protein